MFDIEPFLDRQFGGYVLAGDDYLVDCPFCADRVGKVDTKHHLGVHATEHMVHCFRCDYSNSWVGFVMDASGLPYYRALAELYYKPRMAEFHAKMDLLKGSTTHKKATKIAGLPHDFIPLEKCGYSSGSGRLARRYMERRGFDFNACIHYNIGIADSIPMRVIIPVEQDYWQARRIINWIEPKYLNPKSESRDYIFNPLALQAYDEVAVCEGAFSAMALGYNAIALISKEPTQERIARLLASNVQSFIIALEPGAYGSMGKLMDVLYRAGRNVTVWSYRVGDPADPAGRFDSYQYCMKTRMMLKMQMI